MDLLPSSSPPTTPMSQASTKVGPESSITSHDTRNTRKRALERLRQAATAKDVFLFLLAFRLLNALAIQTFFQPDEYFQSLEPAWQIAFGENSGAWLTWEWQQQLRSSLHPTLFAALYWIAGSISKILRLTPRWHAELLLAAPKLLQAALAATGDYYTWKLGEKAYGANTSEAWATLVLTVCSPWQWFCSTRTFSNCLETTLTTVALTYWPWDWVIEKPETDEDDEDDEDLRRSFDEDRSMELSTSAIDFWDDVMQAAEGRQHLRLSLFLAALACILRPTNVLIWICLVCFTLFRVITYGKIIHLPYFGTPVWVHVSDLTLSNATNQQRFMLVREAAVCGTVALILSVTIDRLYFGFWTFPPVRFLYFNIAQSLAVFYGRNRWDYYLTEGLPLLLTTYLPFALLGIYRAFFNSAPSPPPLFASTTTLTKLMTKQLATIVILVPLSLSMISHKEIRFIYPLLPSLHLLAAGPFATFFDDVLPSFHGRRYAGTYESTKRALLGLMLALNILIALFATTSHQPGPLSVMSYLRDQHIRNYLSQPPSVTDIPIAQNSPSTMTVGFLMPCHSTPWRSHLIFPTIKAWALSCEPPVNMDSSERASYLDEADQFYANPLSWINATLGRPPAQRKYFHPYYSSWTWILGNGWLYNREPPSATEVGMVTSSTLEAEQYISNANFETPETSPFNGATGPKDWPDYVVFFAQLEPVMRRVAKDSAYGECWRTFNSWAHDDWRRKGDVVVWCLREHSIDTRHR